MELLKIGKIYYIFYFIILHIIKNILIKMKNN